MEIWRWIMEVVVVDSKNKRRLENVKLRERTGHAQLCRHLTHVARLLRLLLELQNPVYSTCCLPQD
jgi:hypothetical protein